MTALKVGVIAAPDLLGQEHLPSMEQVAQALSDLIRRWLSPEQLPGDTTAGKQFLAEWLENVIKAALSAGVTRARSQHKGLHKSDECV